MTRTRPPDLSTGTQTTNVPAPGFNDHPEHVIRIRPAEGTMAAYADGIQVAESAHALLLSEARYPEVVYFPLEAVDSALLEASDTTSYCPFKGTATYHHLAWGTRANTRLADALWIYQTPYEECAAIAGYGAFYTSRYADRLRVTRLR